MGSRAQNRGGTRDGKYNAHLVLPLGLATPFAPRREGYTCPETKATE
jgi:hypothetical protein